MIRARPGDRVLQPRRNEAVATRTCSSRALHGALHRPRTIPLPHLRPNARPRNEVSTPTTRFTDLAGPSRKARDRPIGNSRDTDEVARSHPAAERLAPQRLQTQVSVTLRHSLCGVLRQRQRRGSHLAGRGYEIEPRRIADHNAGNSSCRTSWGNATGASSSVGR